MIRAVLFDLDGVIRHFDQRHVANIERRHGIKAGLINRFAFSPPLIEDVTTGRMTRRAWISQIAMHLGNEVAATEWGQQPSEIDPALRELAEEVHRTGRVTAILTNGTDTIPDEMAAAELHDHFEPIFNSADIGYAKPDERVFQHVLDALDVSPEEVFFTDDSPSKLVGADALGIATHHFIDVARLRDALRAHGVQVN